MVEGQRVRGWVVAISTLLNDTGSRSGRQKVRSRIKRRKPSQMVKLTPRRHRADGLAADFGAYWIIVMGTFGLIGFVATFGSWAHRVPRNDDAKIFADHEGIPLPRCAC
jgi:hypothetical protein